MFSKRVAGILAFGVLVVVFYLAPPPEGLTPAGKNALGLLLGGLILWVTEAVPLAITALLLMILQPVLGIAAFGDTMKTFISPVIFFVIATFGISVTVMKTPLATRMARWLLLKAGDDSNRTVLAFMVGTALLSGLLSNVPVTALFMSLALGVVEVAGGKPGKSALGRCLMLAIPFAAMVGGITTPAGSSINILTLYLMNAHTSAQVTFVEWMLFGLPICIVLVPLSWIILVKVFRPEPIPPGTAASIGRDLPEKLTAAEKKWILITGAMVVLWLLSSWVKSIDITLVALAGLAVYFLPGVDLLKWDELNAGIGWDTIIMIGGVTSIGAAVVETGLGKWFVVQSLMGVSGWHIVLLTMAVGTLVNFLHLVLPIAPAIVVVTLPPLLELGQASHIHPAVFALATAFMAGCCMLLPLDAVPLITFSKRYYTMGQMFKVGIVTSMLWVALAGIWIPWVAGLIY